MCQQKLQSALAQLVAKIQLAWIAVQIVWQEIRVKVCAYVNDCAYPCDICKYRPAEQTEDAAPQPGKQVDK
jgi:hypothetical protein